MTVPGVTVVAGPTGSGKTALSLALAERLGAEIVSADSMQFYRGMEIGTAMPTAAERARIPHHFVGFLSPDETMSAGAFQRLARAKVAELQACGKSIVVVGGSGLYLRALLDGLFEGPPRVPALRARLHAEAERHGSSALFERLRTVDPEYAAHLSSPNDLVRIVRALEVYETTGAPYSALHARHRAETRGIEAVWLGLDFPDRAMLYARLDRRVDAMIASGWLEEVRALIDAGYGPQLDRLKTHGYRELAAYLRGEQTLAAALDAVRLQHRRYAKRQLSWFRAERRIHWLDASSGAVAEHAWEALNLPCADAKARVEFP